MLNSENVIIVFQFTKHFIPLKNKKPKNQNKRFPSNF